MTSDFTVQCPHCEALPGHPCDCAPQVHFERRIKGLVMAKRPDLAAKVSDWRDVGKVAALCKAEGVQLK